MEPRASDPAHADAYDTRDWPLFKEWATPIFHVFRNGTLVRTVHGWKAETGADALRGALRAAGLAVDDTTQ